MKKLVLYFLLILISTTINAQKGFSVGVVGGANSIWIINQNNFGTLNTFSQPEVRASELSYKFKFSYQFGIQGTYNFTQKSGVMMQLLYAKAGQKYEDDMFEVGGRINVKRNITLSYLQIPISYKFTTLKSERIKLVIHGGPLIGITLSKKDEIKLDNVLKNDTSFSVKEKFKNIDFGFQLGVGVNININKNFYIPISFTAYYGFVDINGTKTKDIDWYSKNDIKYQRSHNFRAGLTAGICYVFTGSKFYRFKH